MLEIVNGNIRISQGDAYPILLGKAADLLDLGIKIQVRTAPLPEGTLKFDGSIVQIGDDLVWLIGHDDTVDLPVGTYVYDIFADREIEGFSDPFGQHITAVHKFTIIPRTTNEEDEQSGESGTSGGEG